MKNKIILTLLLIFSFCNNVFAANIIHTNGEVQLNTPYTTQEDLDSAGLTDWHIATDDEVTAWQTANADEIKQKADEAQAMKNITKRQMLIWLYTNKGKTEDDIFTAINTISDPTQKYLAKVNYSGTNNFYYGNGFVSVIGQALGLTVDELKAMFDQASQL